MIHLQFWLGDRVSIIDGNVNGVISGIHFYGDADDSITKYSVKFFAEQGLCEADFSAKELASIESKGKLIILKGSDRK